MTLSAQFSNLVEINTFNVFGLNFWRLIFLSLQGGSMLYASLVNDYSDLVKGPALYRMVSLFRTGSGAAMSVPVLASKGSLMKQVLRAVWPSR